MKRGATQGNQCSYRRIPGDQLPVLLGDHIRDAQGNVAFVFESSPSLHWLLPGKLESFFLKGSWVFLSRSKIIINSDK